MKGYFVTRESLIPGWICLKFAYDAAAVERIKTIPSYLRGWDCEAKIWEMEERAFVNARAFLFPGPAWKCILDQTAGNAGAPGDAAPPGHNNGARSNGTASAGTAPTSDWATLFLVPNAPAEVVKAALIRKHHPDMGGDEEIAKQINAAYARLKK